jgi:hypothetical protein
MRRRPLALVTEYEELLSGMLVQKKEKLEGLKVAKGRSSKKKIEALLSEIAYVELELERYRRGMVLFRSKELPKVGRWGRPETGQQGEPLP